MKVANESSKWKCTVHFIHYLNLILCHYRYETVQQGQSSNYLR